MKTLVILYDQYFNGVEKREPMKDRETLAKRLRRFANRRIMQTDLRFKYQNLATRYHSYAGYWDRILRQMDEGRFVRPGSRRGGARQGAPPPESEFDGLYRDYLEAHRSCQVAGPTPSREQIAAFLEQQKGKIREQFGERDVAFRIVTEAGRPKIKVRVKK
ncbi:MXAN_5187 C-terminal domain-containing protein [uncultured Desulfuromonas sp.]|nr:MXAN_5187 C-terminal domain-containing protein [uncultured Desulfuromonas sp.]